jgi:hypothetical protein
MAPYPTKKRFIQTINHKVKNMNTEEDKDALDVIEPEPGDIITDGEPVNPPLPTPPEPPKVVEEPEPFKNCVALGNVAISADNQFACLIDGIGQIDTIMTEQEAGMVSRVVRRANKERLLKEAERFNDE